MQSEIFEHDLAHKNGIIIGQAGSGKSYLLGEMIANILENSNDSVVVYVPRKEYKLNNVSEELQKRIRFEHTYDNSLNSDEPIPPNSWLLCDEFGEKGYSIEGAEFVLSVAKEEGWNLILAVQSIECISEHMLTNIDYAIVLDCPETEKNKIAEVFKVDKNRVSKNCFIELYTEKSNEQKQEKE